MYRVLWIEDEAETQLRNFMHPVIMAGHVIEFVTNVTDAILRMSQEAYDLIILDLIVNAGPDKRWKEIDKDPEEDKNSYLGLQLLRAVFDREASRIDVQVPPEHVSPQKFAIFTIVQDKEIHDEIASFGITALYSKRRSNLYTLMQIIEEQLG